MLGLRESELIAVRLPVSGDWRAILGEAWDAGAAVLPIDDRLPASAVEDLLARARPPVVFDGSSAVRREDGAPVGPDVGLVMATSGSSGEPRLVELTHTAVDAAVGASIARLGARAEDPWLLCLPVAHMGGMLVLLRAARLGAPLHVGGFGPGEGFASVVPTQLVRALDAGEDLGGYRALLVGGAALDPGVAASVPAVTTYGQTETCGGVVYDGEPLDGVGVRIGDGGEIELGGPTLMRGYRLASSQPFTADGWLRTGDAGELLADGRLVVHGRLDDVINTGGEKVWPAAVERVLRAHPSVAEVVVTGRADPEWGSVVVAWVEASDADAPPTLEDLRAFCAEHLPRYAAPREVVVVEQLPRTASGKVRAPSGG